MTGKWRDYAELVRAPAALTVLGDTLVGALTVGKPLRGRRLLLPLASVSLYWGGMALNDWADRDLDAVERSERPIPSGRISAGAALTTALGLTALGVGLAAAGGRNGVPLAAAVWSYDTLLKRTSAGPLAMAACRASDVLLGGRAVVPAALLATHTYGVTTLSRGEVHGTSPRIAKLALAGTALTALVTVADRPHPAGVGSILVYAVWLGRDQAAVVRDPHARTVRTATRTGIHTMILLQAALAARRSPRAAALVLSVPVAAMLARKVSPT
ncbi:SCO3242 family prenyltransferase [Nocardia sp. NPDC004722]